MRLGLFLSILFCLLSPYGHSEELCRTDKTERPVHMEQVRDHVGFCGSFAFRSLLNETLCIHNASDCRLPSVAQIVESLRFTEDLDKIGALKFYQKFLDNFQEKGYYSEECLPFSSLFPDDHKPEQPLNWADTFVFHSDNFVRNYLQASFDPESNCFNKNYFSTRPLPAHEISNFNFGSQILRSLYKDVNEGNAARNKCNLYSLPKLKVKGVKLNEDPQKDPKDVLKDLIKEGPVMVGLKVRQEFSEEIGPHAVTITNYEKVCCFGACEVKYQILDSLGHYWAPGHKEGWVSEQDLFKVLHLGGATQLEVVE